MIDEFVSSNLCGVRGAEVYVKFHLRNELIKYLGLVDDYVEGKYAYLRFQSRSDYLSGWGGDSAFSSQSLNTLVKIRARPTC